MKLGQGSTITLALHNIIVVYKKKTYGPHVIICDTIYKRTI
jgi:hypothetical protein